ncbi:hypothetical protein ACPV5O_25485 [Vibrio maritimus]|uniref:hypothetical protein n=1 Tax=Vibrio maritimus TaxID=990268 RepID=UPI004068B8BC
MTLKRITHDHETKIDHEDSQFSRVHYSKDKDFSFIPKERVWCLGVNKTDQIDFGDLHDSTSELKLEYLGIVTNCAETRSIHTLKSYRGVLNAIKYPSNLNELRTIYPQLAMGTKQNVLSVFSKGLELGYYNLQPIYDWLKKVRKKTEKHSFLDPEKGAYSDDENNSISYSLRITTDKFIQKFKNKNELHTPTSLNKLGVLISLHLIRGILRRPTQIVKMKWSDIRPINIDFNNDIIIPELTDVGGLHLRMFLGKRGDFRGYAEKRSITLTPELSNLIGLYYYHYLKSFIEHLKLQKIVLTKAEIVDIKNRLPFLFDLKLFSTNFKSKRSLFSSLGYNSKSFHKSAPNLNNLLQDFVSIHLSPLLRSDRLEASKLKVNNNRIRHTSFTNGSRKGLSPAQLAALGGVTEKAVRHYVDLTNEARVEINKALENNQILNSFGRISIAELHKSTGYIEVNEYDEEISVISNPNDCNSCKSILGKPLACYPCPNFKPLANANHQQYLEKAERKLLLNSKQNDAITTKRLRKIICYIKATILACQEFNSRDLKGDK